MYTADLPTAGETTVAFSRTVYLYLQFMYVDCSVISAKLQFDAKFHRSMLKKGISMNTTFTLRNDKYFILE